MNNSDNNTNQVVRQADNIVAMEVNGTKYIIHEFLSEGKDTVNDIIARRIKRDLDPSIPTA
ncbi:MAG: hypothetical protein FWF94_04645 [Oscillospiraceae bacterium]|nr:hypothetical protein [Oscillospiraceae bacterium]